MNATHQASGSLSVVHVPDNCGNAPRKIVLRDFLIALYSLDTGQVIAMLHKDIRWEIVGLQTLQGLHSVQDWLQALTLAQELTISSIITHGTDCGADGRVVFADDDTVAYNHMMIFAGHSKTARLKEIRSYLIKVNAATATTVL